MQSRERITFEFPIQDTSSLDASAASQAGEPLSDTTRIRNDHSVRAVVNLFGLPWTRTTHAGVSRILIERHGGERARATSVVRFEPGTSFEAHEHPFGEEVFVLNGTFADEHGVYPAGTYIKNPAGSKHRPGTDEGCTLFVKLQYLASTDKTRSVVETERAQWLPGLVAGLSVLPLSNQTALVRWAPGTTFGQHRHFGGEEILVLDGVFEDEHGSYPAGTWVRSPHLSQHTPFSRQGATILVKTGHLDMP